jgi:hypothetical protein
MTDPIRRPSPLLSPRHSFARRARAPWLLLAALAACSEPQERKGAPGLWYPLRTPPAEQSDEMDELTGVPYLRGHGSEELTGVTRCDLARAQEGLNLVVSAHAPEASLLDLKGEVLHTWSKPTTAVWSGANGARSAFWRRARLLPNGDLLALCEDAGVVRLDKSSRVVWSFAGAVHDDLAVADDGAIWVLVGKAGTPDAVVKLSPEGKEQQRIELAKCVGAQVSRLEGAELRAALRATAIAVAGAEGSGAAWRGGELIVTLPALDAIVALDPQKSEVRQLVRGACPGARAAVPLPSGALLVFDNGYQAEGSRVIELDPATGQAAWTLAGSAAEPLWSRELGACQRLANGNTLITESEGGRAFEVTPDKQIIWEFWNPSRSGDEAELIAGLCEVSRLDRAACAGVLGAEAPGDAGVEIDTGAAERLIEKSRGQ